MQYNKDEEIDEDAFVKLTPLNIKELGINMGNRIKIIELQKNLNANSNLNDENNISYTSSELIEEITVSTTLCNKGKPYPKVDSRIVFETVSQF